MYEPLRLGLLETPECYNKAGMCSATAAREERGRVSRSKEDIMTFISTRSFLGASLALALGASLGACAASGAGDDDGDGITDQAAQAASPAQDCEAAGGTYTAAGPNSTCTFPGEPVGNSSNTKGGSETTG